ncbi:PorP/SprF family type IX secretion system membrane protein [Tamlana sp. 2201CG12-4]|uniref:PorP/SprF family type IX secretion system membrane protein n=1 Tax=Tamlana sp. 2201CG12-4 TaxID=3112582 RepID=UPI002DBAF848|nr:PorP/SprF family type IX secretion system membrane protein [Tamlana sp. 2201CG12-4]MEC3907937.1 PorP/SprF family type IX secretion system membrane protein [Tamlana sp. 2201CG12-4]
MKLKIATVLIIICFYSKVKAQDPIFSQYFLVPETINPGFSGFEEATYMGIMHRTQWPNLNLKVDTEYAYVNTWIETMNSGIGFSFINQRENITNYNHFQFNGNFAYVVRLSNDWFFRPAIEAGFGRKSFNFKNLVLADQININSESINPFSGDPFAINGNRGMNFLDFSAGFVFDKRNTRNDTDMWIGTVIKHLNRPNISLFEGNNLPLDIFYSVHAGYRFPYFDYYKMLLSANYMQQGEYNRLDLSSTVQINKLLLGLTAVTNPAKNGINNHLLTSINSFIGLELEKLRFGLSYDFNTSKIGRTDGVYELSITYLTGCLICRDPAKLERRK